MMIKKSMFLLTLLLLATSCGDDDENLSGPPTLSLMINSGGVVDEIVNKVAFIERTGGNIFVEIEFSTPELYDRSTYRSQFGYGPSFLAGDIDVEEDKLNGSFSIEYVGPERISATGEEGTFAVFDKSGQKDSLTIHFSK